MKIACGHCGKLTEKAVGAVNRARKVGMAMYCDRKCSGAAKRKGKTKAQRIAEKRLYDMEYRRKNSAMLKGKKAAYFRRTYDPAKAAVERQARMKYHVEYCRQPEYRAKKKVYDRKHRAEKFYGAYAECFMLVQDIRDECLRQMSDYEIRLDKGTLNKRNQRRRDHDRLVREEPEIGPVGHAQFRQGRQNGSLAG